MIYERIVAFLQTIMAILAFLFLQSIMAMSIGPWGGNGGDIWDDGVHTGIRQIILTYGDVINSINIEYDNNGSSVWLKHGTTTGTKTEKVVVKFIVKYICNC